MIVCELSCRHLRDYLKREQELQEVNEGYKQMCMMLATRKAEMGCSIEDDEDMDIEDKSPVHVVLGEMGGEWR